jgi:hypothetical protein
MRRADDDTWDLASSVGATATMVAAARAVATRSPDPLVSDPFAEPLVKAVGIDFFARLACAELQPGDIDDGTVPRVQQMADVVAVRTRYFDQFFTHAVGAGAPGGDPGLRTRYTRLPAAVAGGNNGLRNRPASGHRVQVRDADRSQCPDSRPSRGGSRSAPGLASRVATSRI